MTNVIPFRNPSLATVECPEKESEPMRLPYSFDLIQVGDNVVIDACVPSIIGAKIAQLIMEHATADKEPKLAKRESKKRVAR